MAKRYPQEIKDQAAALYAEGLSTVKIGRRLGVSRPTVYRWVTPKGQASVQRQKEDPRYKERQRVYRSNLANRERRRERDKVYYAVPKNRERKRYQKEYRQRPGVRERKKECHNERYAADPAYRILKLLRRRTSKVLKGHIIKSAGTEDLLGIPVLELTQHWDAEYGPNWRTNPDLHIDHIRPCSSFDLLDPAQQQLCFNYRNLQLLSAAENLSKGDSWTPEMESAWTERMRDLGWEGGLSPIHHCQIVTTL